MNGRMCGQSAPDDAENSTDGARQLDFQCSTAQSDCRFRITMCTAWCYLPITYTLLHQVAPGGIPPLAGNGSNCELACVRQTVCEQRHDRR
jgi:hypothetical protein